MLRRRLGLIIPALILAFSSSVLRADFGRTPAFLVFRVGVDQKTILPSLRSQGVHLHQSIPPRVAQVDVPSGTNPSTLEGVERAYTGKIPLADIRPLGPLALAAALQWNKSQSSPTGPQGALGSQSFGDGSFDAPSISSLANGPAEIHLSWSPVDGAFFYEVQVSPDPSFGTSVLRSLTDLTSLRLPLSSSGLPTVYTRVRAGERSIANGSIPDKLGAWSAVRSLSVPAGTSQTTGTVPQPTSPVDGYQSAGFSVVLEWMGAPLARIQVARDQDFQDILVDQIVDKQEFTPASSSLHVGDHIYWRISQWGTGASNWSVIRKFDVSDPRPSSDDSFVNPEAPR